MGDASGHRSEGAAESGLSAALQAFKPAHLVIIFSSLLRILESPGCRFLCLLALGLGCILPRLLLFLEALAVRLKLSLELAAVLLMVLRFEGG